jgi:hypothetical protein
MRRGEHCTNGNLSDLYFGDVLPSEVDEDTDVEIYNWNLDGDGRFGENGDGHDLLPELYVARLPFRTPDQVKSYLEKYFAYAGGKDGDYLGRALVVGAEEFGKRQEALTGKIRAFGGAGDYVVDTLIEVPVPKIVEAMSKGYGILDIFGHGCPHHMWLGEKRSHFGVPQIRTLTNKGKYGIVYSQGCSANDYRKWESMGVAFLNHPKGGAVAYTGYTATAFGSPVNQAFSEIVFGGKVPQIARAMAEAKKKLLGDRWMNEYLNTLGEPEMWVWTAKPKKLRVEGTLTAGRPARLRVLSGDAPASGARVCLRQRNLYLTGHSDEKGWVDLPGLEGTGRAQVSVLAQNHVPFEGGLSVARAEGAVLKAPKWIVDDDKDGESRGNGKGDLSPDERVELRFQWPVPPAKGTLTLEVDDPYVKLVRRELDAGKEDGAFLLEILGSVRPGHQVWATVRLAAPGVEGTWRWRKSLPVRGPSLLCVRATVEDRKGNKDGRLGWEDAGAEVGLKVTVYNRGNQPAYDTALTLRCEDAAVQVVSGETRLGTVKPNDSLETRTAFGLRLDEKFDGRPVAFLLTLRDKGGGVWKATIRIAVPPAPPILLSHAASTRHVRLSWRPGGTTAVFGYNVYRASRSGGPFKRLTDKPIRGMTVFRDGTVKPNGSYYYVVTSMTAEGLESEPSKEHLARTLSALWGRKG